MGKRMRIALASVLVAAFAAAVAGYAVVVSGMTGKEQPPRAQAGNPPAEQPDTGVCSECGGPCEQIRSEQQLAFVVSENQKGGGAAPTGKCYRLEADLNLSAWDDTAIGGRTKEAPFTGHFDGNGHTLTYRVQGGALSGLFPYVGAAEADPAVIRNLHCSVTQTAVEENAEDTVSYGALIRSAQNCEISGITVSQTFEGRAERAAGIAGELLADGVIEDCAVASAAGKYYTYGGVVKMLYGKVEGCRYALGEGASELERFGGICEGMGGTVDSCQVSFPAEGVKAVVTETHMGGYNGGRVGGIASSVGAGTVSGCRVVYNVTEAGDAPYLGGIAGWLDVNRNAITEEGVSIRDCRITGTAIRGGTMVGGVAGYFQRTLGYRYEISGIDVEVGSIEGAGDYVGGLFGRAIADGDAKVADCSVTADVRAAGCMAGGFIGNLTYSKLDERETSCFSMSNCHMYGTSVVAGGLYPANAGGAIGSVNFISTGAPYCSTSITDCSSAANVSGLGNLGGFLGNFSSAEVPLSATEYQIQRCIAYGNAAATGLSHQVAGFAGKIDSENLRIADCRAYGSAAVPLGISGTGGTHAGGFIGVVNQMGAVERCEAFGDAEGGGGIAGFIGRLNAGTVKNCKAWGNVESWWQSGGFVGWLATASTHEDNEAHGNVVVRKAGHFGGYAGGIYDVEGMDKNFYAKNCTAYGNVTDASDSGNSGLGGFVGCLITSVKAEFVGCAAYGNIAGADSGGGFVGASYAVLSTTQVAYTNCAAYGNVRADRIATSQGGGFAGLVGWGNYLGTTNFTGCKAYGSVAGRDEAGGLLGLVASKVVVTSCGYYGASITNDAEFDTWRAGLVSGFSLYGGGTADGSIVTDCEYTTVNRVHGYRGDFTVTENNNRYLGAVPVNPKGMIAVAFSGAGNTFTVAFTNAAGFKVTELAVSSDGGKYYTQLVHSGKALVTLTPQAAGQNPLSCQNFSYTYSMVSPGAVRVRITVTNGTDTVTMVF